MKREIITIGENGSVQVPTTPVWMSACEIADLLGAFSGKVSAQIKAIFKEGLLMEAEAMRTIHSEQGFIDLRRWIIDRLSEKKVSSPPMIICYTFGRQHN